MSVIVRQHYRPGGAAARFSIRDVHLDYMIAHRALIVCGGALLDQDGMTVTGMFLTLDVSELQAAEKFLEDEPYNRAGLFATTSIELLLQFIPHQDPRFLEDLLAESRLAFADTVSVPSDVL